MSGFVFSVCYLVGGKVCALVCATHAMREQYTRTHSHTLSRKQYTHTTTQGAYCNEGATHTHTHTKESKELLLVPSKPASRND